MAATSWGEWCRGFHRSLLSPPFSTESAVINATVKVASLPFRDSRSKDHELPYGFWQQRGSWTATWSPASPHAMDPQHSLQWQYRPWASPQPSAKAWATNTIIALGGSPGQGHQHGLWCNTGHSTTMVSSGSGAHRHQHGFRWLHRPWTSECPSVITWATDTNTFRSCSRTDPDMDTGNCSGHSHQRGT